MPCRIFTANDEQPLIEDLAREMWESVRERGELIQRYEPWETVSGMWRTRFLDWARDMRRVAMRLDAPGDVVTVPRSRVGEIA